MVGSPLDNTASRHQIQHHTSAKAPTLVGPSTVFRQSGYWFQWTFSPHALDNFLQVILAHSLNIASVISKRDLTRIYGIEKGEKEFSYLNRKNAGGKSNYRGKTYEEIFATYLKKVY